MEELKRLVENPECDHALRNEVADEYVNNSPSSWKLPRKHSKRMARHCDRDWTLIWKYDAKFIANAKLSTNIN